MWTRINLTQITRSPEKVLLLSRTSKYLPSQRTCTLCDTENAERQGLAHTVYVDAADYTSVSRMALTTADSEPKVLTCSSVMTNSSMEAGDAAISHLHAYLPSGYIPRTAARFLRLWQHPSAVSLTWTPEHADPPPPPFGNEEAHSLARTLTFRARHVEPPPQAEEHLLLFRDIFSYCRDQRLKSVYTHPQPHP
ncbi:hypothetical protein HPB50_006601 [Hyalomma asiaticum]|uniref:Uncharacterized protein n=1 Tax=Hyalomma asiaticum TaxID=266040 RepID=A0ACB7SNC4_HYAAI|nr:hypothetical protein HPB50_006601 [Hyalomma asiaticum]